MPSRLGSAWLDCVCSVKSAVSILAAARKHDNRHPPRLSVQKTNAPRLTSCCDINPADEVGVNSPKLSLAHFLLHWGSWLLSVWAAQHRTQRWVTLLHCLCKGNMLDELFGEKKSAVRSGWWSGSNIFHENEAKAQKTSRLWMPAWWFSVLSEKFHGFRFFKKTCAHLQFSSSLFL